MKKRVARFTVYGRWLWPYYLRTAVKWSLMDIVMHAVGMKQCSFRNATTYIYNFEGIRIEQNKSQNGRIENIVDEAEKGIIFGFDL